ncbi:MYXO-CTERM sorting domain-containing protein [Arthrobacter sp. 131MFCol6.1]
MRRQSGCRSGPRPGPGQNPSSGGVSLSALGIRRRRRQSGLIST